jgi:hypothetical protein
MMKRRTFTVSKRPMPRGVCAPKEGMRSCVFARSQGMRRRLVRRGSRYIKMIQPCTNHQLINITPPE